MDWKEFLQPDVKKLVLLIVFLFLSIAISHHGNDCFAKGGGCTTNYGLPFAVYSIHQYDLDILETYPNNPETSSSLSYSYLISNTIFWYLISCTLFLGYNKIKAKN